MQTNLFEFINKDNQIVRWILTLPKNNIKWWVVFLHGFERCSSTEKKFKVLSDELTQNNFATLRLDFLGCWLSDWDFQSTTIDNQKNTFLEATIKFKEKIWNNNISIVAHSLGACILANWIKETDTNINKIVLIAPALNQKDLMRYWFVNSQMKKNNSDILITRENYTQHLNEESFIKDCQRTDKTTKKNYISSQYFLEAKDLDFSNSFDNRKKDILHIHWMNDSAVPLESLHTSFKNQILIERGDHDLENPNQIKQRKDKTVLFLIQ